MPMNRRAPAWHDDQTATTIDFTTLQLNGSILQRSDQTSSLALQVFELLMLTVWLFVLLVAIKLNKWFE